MSAHHILPTPTFQAEVICCPDFEFVTFPNVPNIRFRLVKGCLAHCLGDDGSFWKHVSNRWKQMRGKTSRCGCVYVEFHDARGNQKRSSLDCLVLETFVGVCPNECECCHADGDPSNNDLNNLYWVTPTASLAVAIPFPDVRAVEFRLIKDWSAYAVGNDGSLWSRWTKGKRGNARLGNRWRQMTSNTHTNGYLYISLYDTSGNSVRRYLHQLVLEAFVGPCPEGMECCHNDGDPSNNCLENLRWDTSAANSADTRKHGTLLRGSRISSSKLVEEQVQEIRRRLRAHESYRAIAVSLDVSCSAVADIANGRTWSWLPVNQ